MSANKTAINSLVMRDLSHRIAKRAFSTEELVNFALAGKSAFCNAARYLRTGDVECPVNNAAGVFTYKYGDQAKLRPRNTEDANKGTEQLFQHRGLWKLTVFDHENFLSESDLIKLGHVCDEVEVFSSLTQNVVTLLPYTSFSSLKSLELHGNAAELNEVFNTTDHFKELESLELVVFDNLDDLRFPENSFLSLENLKINVMDNRTFTVTDVINVNDLLRHFPSLKKARIVFESMMSESSDPHDFDDLFKIFKQMKFSAAVLVFVDFDCVQGIDIKHPRYSHNDEYNQISRTSTQNDSTFELCLKAGYSMEGLYR